MALLCVEDQEVRRLLPQISRPVLTYGFNEAADLRATSVRSSEHRTCFDVALRGQPPFPVQLNLPGRHNALNALAAVGVALELGVGVAAIQRGLAQFEGIGRRFHVSESQLAAGGRVMLIDDYGHHPRELMATLEAVREGWPGQRLILAFQPHRYSRTRDTFEDFVKVLSTVDVLVLTEVFAAGEQPISGATGRDLSRAVRARGQVVPVFVDDLSELAGVLSGLLVDGDILLTMGAGDIGGVAADLPKELSV